MISGHCRIALARMLSADALISDLSRGLTNMDIDRDYNVPVG